VLLAAVALWLEWWLYYAARERQRAAEVRESPGDQPPPESKAGLDLEPEELEKAVVRNPNLIGR
jgi:hypothetical protein